MTKKTFLSKVLPALLVVVLAVILVVVISSCSRTKKTPTGNIEKIDDYITVTLSNGEKVSVSKTKFYNQLRYIGYDSFAEELNALIFADYVKAIEDDLNTNKDDLTKSAYYEKMVDYINEVTYGTADEDDIADMEQDDKDKREKQFLSSMAISGMDVDDTKGIYQYATFEYYVVELAKAEYARSVLLEEATELDGEFEITDEDIADRYDKNYQNRGDISAILILFSSDIEIEEVLKTLGLKYVKEKLYRVPAVTSDYEQDYADFSSTADGVSDLAKNEVLFEFIRMYNYMYGSYRAKLTLTIDNVVYTPEIDNLTYKNASNVEQTKAYDQSIYAAIKNTTIEDMTADLLAQNQTDGQFPRVTYTYEDLNSFDTSVTDDLYRKYLADSSSKPSYSTSGGNYTAGKYLVYKLADCADASYSNIKTLAQFVDAVDNKNTEYSLNAYISQLKEIYEDRLKTYGIFNDNDKIKEYFYGTASKPGYAKTITALGVTGAKNIIDKAWDKEDSDSIFNEVFEEKLTADYITSKVNEYMEDECKITIYDELFEVQFAAKQEFYRLSKKQSKELVASVKVGDKTNSLTVDEMFTSLNRKYGADKALELVVNQILKDKYYDQIDEDDLEDFEDEYDNTLTYFATGQSAQYGFPASIGQRAFIQLYFHTDNREEAIFNMWVVQKLQDICIFENPDDIYENIYADLSDLTKLTYDDFFNLSYQYIIVYTDDDEDGKQDDWTLVDETSSASLQARKAEVEKLSAELMQIIYEQYQEAEASSKGDSYATICGNYRNASRVSSSYIDFEAIKNGSAVLPTFKTLKEKNAYYYGKFKKAGLLLTTSAALVDSFDEIDPLDDELADQLSDIYHWYQSKFVNGSTKDQHTFAHKSLDGEYDFGSSPEYINLDTEELCLTKQGYLLINIMEATEAASAKFLFADNLNDSVNGKVYPYSIDPDNLFPKDEEGNPIDSYTDENTLYNETDDATANQIEMYIREYSDGVESLSESVTTALKTFFDAKVYSYFISSSFNYIIYADIMDSYIAEDKVSFNNKDLLDTIYNMVDAQKEGLFGYETTDFSEAWWNIFK